MDGWYVLFILLMSPAALALTRGWWVWAEDRKQADCSGKRGMFTLFGLFAASLSMILELVFLLHGYHGTHSFGGPPVGIWLVVGRAAGAFFILTLIAAIVGRGRARLWMFVYCGLMAFFAFGLILLAYD
jgi:hypothetical protein